jgi:hypothetical protein
VEEALAGRMKQCPQGSPQCVLQGGGIVAGIVPSTCPGINPSRFHNNSFILLPVFSINGEFLLMIIISTIYGYKKLLVYCPCTIFYPLSVPINPQRAV